MKVPVAPCAVTSVVSVPGITSTHIDVNNYELKGGFFKDGQYAWMSRGPFFYIVEVETGRKVANHFFCSTTADLHTEVMCVAELSANQSSRKLSYCVLGLRCDVSRDMFCIFDITLSRVLRAINMPSRVLSMCVVEESEVRHPLSNTLSIMSGVIALGLQDGLVVLLDTAQHDWEKLSSFWQTDYHENVRGEQNPCTLLQLSIGETLQDLKWKKATSVESGAHLSVLLNGNSFIGDEFILRGPGGHTRKQLPKREVAVTALMYIHRCASLVVGFSMGSFQIWSLSNLSLCYTSMVVGGEPLPVVHLGFQEPSDDPRNFCYLWAVHSSTAESSGTRGPVGYMYALFFKSKDWMDGYGCLYRDFQSCHMRLQYVMPMQDCGKNVVASRCVSYQTLNSICQRNFSESDYDDSVSENDVCAFVWEMYGSEGETKATRLSLFDLNQWYKDQMPGIVKDEVDGINPCYLVTFSLADIWKCKGPGPLLDVRIDPHNIQLYKSFQSHEEHFQPSALSFVSRNLLGEKIVSVSHPGVQRFLLYKMDEEGPLVLLDPKVLFRNCLKVGLRPLLVDLPVNTTTVSELEMRHFLLSVALENGKQDFLHHCAEEWANGSHSKAGCTLHMLVEWGYRRAMVLKKHLFSLCKSLFDHSGEYLDKNQRAIVDNCVLQLHHLSTLFQNIIDCSQQYCSSEFLENLKSMASAFKLLDLYFEVLMWFLNGGLLPEVPEDSEEDQMNSPSIEPQNIPYRVTTLTKIYQERRKELENVSSKSGQLLPLFIDALLSHEPAKGVAEISELWCSDGGDGYYPPPSLQSLLKIYLVEDISTAVKHSIVIYAFLDLVSLLDAERYKGTVNYIINFPTGIGMSTSSIKIIQAFYFLDQKNFEDALDMILDPLVNPTEIKPWQHSYMVSALTCQGEHAKALEYCERNLPDVKLKISLLVIIGHITEAHRVQRQNRNDTNCIELLEHFYSVCEKEEKLGLVLNLHLLPLEEEVFMNYLETSKHPKADDMRVLYFLMRRRIVEAINMNNKINGNSRKTDTSVRSQLVEAFAKTLPSVTQTLLQHCIQERKALSKWKQVDRPTPLSVIVRPGASQPVSYKSSLYLATLEKARETWLIPIVPPCTPISKQKKGSAIQFMPFLCTPQDGIREDVLSSSAIISSKRSQQEQGGTPRKRPCGERSVPSVPTEPKHSRLSIVTEMLQSPHIERTPPTSRKATASKTLMFSLTPQSILKGWEARRSLSPENGIQTPTAATCTTPELLDEIEEERSTSTRQIRFSLPSRRSFNASSPAESVSKKASKSSSSSSSVSDSPSKKPESDSCSPADSPFTRSKSSLSDNRSSADSTPSVTRRSYTPLAATLLEKAMLSSKKISPESPSPSTRKSKAASDTALPVSLKKRIPNPVTQVDTLNRPSSQSPVLSTQTPVSSPSKSEVSPSVPTSAGNLIHQRKSVLGGTPRQALQRSWIMMRTQEGKSPMHVEKSTEESVNPQEMASKSMNISRSFERVTTGMDNSREATSDLEMSVEYEDEIPMDSHEPREQVREMPIPEKFPFGATLADVKVRRPISRTESESVSVTSSKSVSYERCKTTSNLEMSIVEETHEGEIPSDSNEQTEHDRGVPEKSPLGGFTPADVKVRRPISRAENVSFSVTPPKSHSYQQHETSFSSSKHVETFTTKVVPEIEGDSDSNDYVEESDMVGDNTDNDVANKDTNFKQKGRNILSQIQVKRVPPEIQKAQDDHDITSDSTVTSKSLVAMGGEKISSGIQEIKQTGASEFSSPSFSKDQIRGRRPISRLSSPIKTSSYTSLQSSVTKTVTSTSLFASEKTVAVSPSPSSGYFSIQTTAATPSVSSDAVTKSLSRDIVEAVPLLTRPSEQDNVNSRNLLGNVNSGDLSNDDNAAGEESEESSTKSMVMAEESIEKFLIQTENEKQQLALCDTKKSDQGIIEINVSDDECVQDNDEKTSSRTITVKKESHKQDAEEVIVLDSDTSKTSDDEQDVLEITPLPDVVPSDKVETGEWTLTPLVPVVFKEEPMSLPNLEENRTTDGFSPEKEMMMEVESSHTADESRESVEIIEEPDLTSNVKVSKCTVEEEQVVNYHGAVVADRNATRIMEQKNTEIEDTPNVISEMDVDKDPQYGNVASVLDLEVADVHNQEERNASVADVCEMSDMNEQVVTTSSDIRSNKGLIPADGKGKEAISEHGNEEGSLLVSDIPETIKKGLDNSSITCDERLKTREVMDSEIKSNTPVEHEQEVTENIDMNENTPVTGSKITVLDSDQALSPIGNKAVIESPADVSSGVLPEINTSATNREEQRLETMEVMDSEIRSNIPVVHGQEVTENIPATDSKITVLDSEQALSPIGIKEITESPADVSSVVLPEINTSAINHEEPGLKTMEVMDSEIRSNIPVEHEQEVIENIEMKDNMPVTDSKITVVNTEHALSPIGIKEVTESPADFSSVVPPEINKSASNCEEQESKILRSLQGGLHLSNISDDSIGNLSSIHQSDLSASIEEVEIIQKIVRTKKPNMDKNKSPEVQEVKTVQKVVTTRHGFRSHFHQDKFSDLTGVRETKTTQKVTTTRKKSQSVQGEPPKMSDLEELEKTEGKTRTRKKKSRSVQSEPSLLADLEEVETMHKVVKTRKLHSQAEKEVETMQKIVKTKKRITSQPTLDETDSKESVQNAEPSSITGSDIVCDDKNVVKDSEMELNISEKVSNIMSEAHPVETETRRVNENLFQSKDIKISTETQRPGNEISEGSKESIHSSKEEEIPMETEISGSKLCLDQVVSDIHKDHPSGSEEYRSNTEMESSHSKEPELLMETDPVEDNSKYPMKENCPVQSETFEVDVHGKHDVKIEDKKRASRRRSSSLFESMDLTKERLRPRQTSSVQSEPPVLSDVEISVADSGYQKSGYKSSSVQSEPCDLTEVSDTSFNESFKVKTKRSSVKTKQPRRRSYRLSLREKPPVHLSDVPEMSETESHSVANKDNSTKDGEKTEGKSTAETRFDDGNSATGHDVMEVVHSPHSSTSLSSKSTVEYNARVIDDEIPAKQETESSKSHLVDNKEGDTSNVERKQKKSTSKTNPSSPVMESPSEPENAKVHEAQIAEYTTSRRLTRHQRSLMSRSMNLQQALLKPAQRSSRPDTSIQENDEDDSNDESEVSSIATRSSVRRQELKKLSPSSGSQLSVMKEEPHSPKSVDQISPKSRTSQRSRRSARLETPSPTRSEVSVESSVSNAHHSPGSSQSGYSSRQRRRSFQKAQQTLISSPAPIRSLRNRDISDTESIGPESIDEDNTSGVNVHRKRSQRLSLVLPSVKEENDVSDDEADNTDKESVVSAASSRQSRSSVKQKLKPKEITAKEKGSFSFSSPLQISKNLPGDTGAASGFVFSPPETVLGKTRSSHLSQQISSLQTIAEESNSDSNKTSSKTDMSADMKKSDSHLSNQEEPKEHSQSSPEKDKSPSSASKTSPRRRNSTLQSLNQKYSKLRRKSLGRATSRRTCGVFITPMTDGENRLSKERQSNVSRSSMRKLHSAFKTRKSFSLKRKTK